MPSKKPWKIARDTFGCLRVWDADGTMIGGVHEDEWNDQEISEHVNMIAAAPELLAACEAFMTYHEDAENSDDVVAMLNYGDAKDKIIAAIAKAKGGATC